MVKGVTPTPGVPKNSSTGAKSSRKSAVFIVFHHLFIGFSEFLNRLFIVFWLGRGVGLEGLFLGNLVWFLEVHSGFQIVILLVLPGV